HVQDLVALEIDCDGDALLAKVRQTGPACHTGKPTCFHNRAHGAGDVALPELLGVLDARLAQPDPASHTSKLLASENLRLKKLTEEGGELIMAAKDHDKAKVAE